VSEVDGTSRRFLVERWVASDRLPEIPAAVVDPATMAVHGTQALYVADASVMPTITRGNTQAPTIMIAERAAARIAHAGIA
jgi:choline dehydrogenase